MVGARLLLAASGVCGWLAVSGEDTGMLARISLDDCGATSTTACATSRCALGSTLATAFTISAAFAGAADAAACAIWAACFGCNSAAVAATVGAVSGDFFETAPTTARVSAGLVLTAVLTTLAAMVSRLSGFAAETSVAALAGISAVVTLFNSALMAAEDSSLAEATPQVTTNASVHASNLTVFIVFCQATLPPEFRFFAVYLADSAPGVNGNLSCQQTHRRRESGCQVVRL